MNSWQSGSRNNTTPKSTNRHPAKMNGGWDSNDCNRVALDSDGLWRLAGLCNGVRGYPVFCLAYVLQGQRMGSMSDWEVMVEQMVLDIFRQAFQLDDVCLPLFLNWLTAHCGKVKDAIQLDMATLRRADVEEQFKSALKTWLGSLPAQGMLWEYRLLLDEIAWWRDLDPHRLLMILKSEAGQ